MRLLITGGAGFIGSNVAKMAVADARFAEVIIVDDLSTGSMTNLEGLDAQLVTGSILNADVLDDAVGAADVVIHLAAIPSVPRSIKAPVATHEANATGTLLLLEACRRHSVQSLIVASSSSVYGLNTAMPKRERDWVRPLSPYAVSKLATEQYVLAYQSCFGLPSLAFRFFNVYGPGQTARHAYAAVVPAFIDAILSAQEVKIFGDGTQSRDFTFVGSVCEVLLTAASSATTHAEPVNLAFGTSTSLLDLVREIEMITNLTAKKAMFPERPGDVAHSRADNSSLLRLFPELRPTPLESGLAQTIEWFRGA